MRKRCIDSYEQMKHNAEALYLNADNNIDNLRYDLGKYGLYSNEIEMYILQKYYPDEYKIKFQETLQLLMRSIIRKDT